MSEPEPNATRKRRPQVRLTREWLEVPAGTEGIILAEGAGRSVVDFGPEVGCAFGVPASALEVIEVAR